MAIYRLLKKISASGTAVLVATHDLGVAKEFRARTLVLEQGRLVSDQIQAAEGPAPAAPRIAHPMRPSRKGVTP